MTRRAESTAAGGSCARSAWAPASRVGARLGWSFLLVWMALHTGSLAWAKRSAPPKAQLVADAKRRAQQEASAALDTKNPERAEELLTRAFRADPDPELLYLLGRVAQAQGRPVAALDLYRRYQDLVDSGVSAENTAAIEQLAASITTPMTPVTVSADGGTLLWVDDRLVGRLPLRSPLLLTGGAHRFRMEGGRARYESDALAIPESRPAALQLTPGARGTAIAVLSLTPLTMIVLRPKTVAEAVQQAVKKAMQEAAGSKRLAPLSDARVGELLSKRAANCLDEPECLLAVAEKGEARSVLRVEVADGGKGTAGAAPFASCTLQVEYLDVNAGQTAAHVSTPITACAGQPLTEAAAAGLQQLLNEAAGRARGTVAVDSVPAGAGVRVDGVYRGVTPYSRPAFSGPHEIVVENENYLAFRTNVEVVPGQVAQVQAELQTKAPPEPPTDKKPPPALVAAPPPVDRRQPRPRWRLALGGIAVGGGLLMAGFGASALSLDGQCVDPAAPDGTCDTIHNTGPVGGGLLGAGLAIAAGGVVLLAVPGPRRPVPVQVQVQVPGHVDGSNEGPELPTPGREATERASR